MRRSGPIIRASSARRLRRVAAFVVLLAALAGPGVEGAWADPIDDLREEAAQLDAELMRLHEQVDIASDEYNKAVAAANAAHAAAEAARSELAAVESETESREGELRQFAIKAYVLGGDVANLDGVLLGDATELGRRRSYLAVAAGDRDDLVDSLQLAADDLSLQRTRAEQARQRADALAAEAAERLEVGQALIDRQAELIAAADDRLTQALAEAERARIEAEAAAARATLVSQSAVTPTNPAPAPIEVTALLTNPPAARTGPAAAPAPPPPSAPAANPAAQIAVNEALAQIGVPYVYGGGSPGGGFDCSGLVQWAWAAAGYRLSHAADWQRDETHPIGVDDLQPGDLVFYGEPPSHVALYIGNDQIVNAPYTGEYVRIQSMWYSSKPMTFGRVA